MKKTVSILLSLCTIICMQAFCQNNNDSLITAARISVGESRCSPCGEDTGIVKLFIRAGKVYTRQNPDSAIFFYTRAYNLCKLNLDNGSKPRRTFLDLGRQSLTGLGFAEKNRDSIASAIDYMNKALELARKGTDKQAVAEAYDDLGNVYKSCGNYSKALEMYNRSHDISRSAGDSLGVAFSLNNMGLVYWKMDRYTEALDYFNRSLKLKEIYGEPKDIAGSYLNMGVFYYTQESYEEARKYWEKSHDLFTKANYLTGIRESLNNLGAISILLGDYTKGEEYLLKSFQIAEELGDRASAALVLGNLGELYDKQGNPKKSYEAFQRALVIYKETSDSSGISSILLSIGRYYQQGGFIKEAIENTKNGLAIARSAGILSYQSDACLMLSEMYETDGNSKLALQYYKDFHQIQDSINQFNKSDLLAEMQVKYEGEEKQREIELLNRDKLHMDDQLQLKNERIARQQILLYSVGIGIILLLVSLYLLFRTSSARKAANRELLTQRAELKKKNDAINNQSRVFSDINQQLEKQNLRMKDSLQYASKIQEALLPDEAVIRETIGEHFVFFRPLEIVSGDFYWVGNKDGKRILVVADCTGHGVPGALMSMIGMTLLNEIVNFRGITDPGQILSRLNRSVTDELNPENSEETADDGMEVTVCVIDEQSENIEISSAGQNCILFLGQSTQLIQGDVYTIGGLLNRSRETVFSVHRFPVAYPASLYFFTDGITDQFGGPENTKLGLENLKRILTEIKTLPVLDQKAEIEKTFKYWKGECQQIDDVCVMGVMLKKEES
jgi:serine phosphatase RsbU (regulator of sigma subunit)/Tfp pilus assembly protein PilF